MTPFTRKAFYCATIIALYWVCDAVMGRLDFALSTGICLMIVLLCVYTLRSEVDALTAEAGSVMLPLMPLFIIPASVAVVDYLPLIHEHLLSIALALFISNCIAMTLTAFIYSTLSDTQRDT